MSLFPQLTMFELLQTCRLQQWLLVAELCCSLSAALRCSPLVYCLAADRSIFVIFRLAGRAGPAQLSHQENWMWSARRVVIVSGYRYAVNVLAQGRLQCYNIDCNSPYDGMCGWCRKLWWRWRAAETNLCSDLGRQSDTATHYNLCLPATQHCTTMHANTSSKWQPHSLLCSASTICLWSNTAITGS